MRLTTCLKLGTGLGLGLLGGAILEAGMGFVLREAEVEALRPGQEPLRVLHISDIHLMPYQRQKLSFISRLHETKPDLVINTGDNISSADSIEPLIDALGPLMDAPGGFVFGTNDMVSPLPTNPFKYLVRDSSTDQPKQHDPLPWRRLRGEFEDHGWVDLDNASGTVKVGNRTIELRGTADAHANIDRYDLVAGPRNDDCAASFAVTHAPYQRVLNGFVDDDMDMIFAGHTHGGQICLPVNRALVANCDIPLSQASGVSEWTNNGRTVPLHVSAGLGTSPYAPIRLFCRPEATLLTLVAKK